MSCVSPLTSDYRCSGATFGYSFSIGTYFGALYSSSQVCECSVWRPTRTYHITIDSESTETWPHFHFIVDKILVEDGAVVLLGDHSYRRSQPVVPRVSVLRPLCMKY